VYIFDPHIAAVRHIFVLQGDAKLSLLAEALHYRALILGFTPVMPNLPGIAALIDIAWRSGLNQHLRLRGSGFRSKMVDRINQQTSDERRGDISVLIRHPRYGRVRPRSRLSQ